MNNDREISILRRGEVSFAKPIARALLRDGRLSFAARGLFAFLWDLPAGWQPRPTHLIKMSGAGKDALGRLRKELEECGGLVVEEIRLTAEDAVLRNQLNPGRQRPYRAGQVVGSRWVLSSPELWAIEMPLGTVSNEGGRDAGFPDPGVIDYRQNRKSEDPHLRFTEFKGSSNEKQQIPRSEFSAAATSCPEQKKSRRSGDQEVRYGVEIWTASDEAGLDELVAIHGAECVESVAKTIPATSGHRAPYLSSVAAVLHQLSAKEARRNAMEAKRRDELPPSSPEVALEHIKIAKNILNGRAAK